MANDSLHREEHELLKATLRLNGKVLGILLGSLFGLVIFMATNWLIIKGGAADERGEVRVGPHLELLGQYFLGYNVSFVGSLIGFAYGFAMGLLTGIVLAWVYNRVVDLNS